MAMAENRRRRKRRKLRPVYFDYNMLACVIILIFFGLVMLYSASAYEAANDSAVGFDDMFYFKRQLRSDLFAFVICFFFIFFDYHKAIKWSPVLYVVALGLMLAVASPLGVTVNGARRWLNLGFGQFQPSEIAKIAIILFLPWLIMKMGKNVNTWRGGLFLIVVGLIQGIAAYIFTDNLSTGIIILLIAVVMVFLASPKVKPFVIAGLIAAGLVVAFLIYVKYNLTGSSSFRMRRILAWLEPEQNMDTGGYQVLQGLYAIGSGGFFGKGLGNSTQKLATIPEAQNDMIFSIICEELGLFGAILVLLLFGYLLYRLCVIAMNAPDLYGTLVAAGVFTHVALQVILNICVVLNVIPTTGVTLPFVSYGGTSVVFLMSEIGIALNISRSIRYEEQENGTDRKRRSTERGAQRVSRAAEG